MQQVHQGLQLTNRCLYLVQGNGLECIRKFLNLPHRFLPGKNGTILLDVVLLIEQYDVSIPAVTSSTSDLLIPLHRRQRQLKMKDQPHILLVDPHTERGGCHDDPLLSRQEFAQHLVFLLSGHSGMVFDDLAFQFLLFFQVVVDEFNRVAGRGVEDYTAAGTIFFD